jgi:hypothetical protein
MRCCADLAISVGRRLMASRGESDIMTAGCFLEEARKVYGHRVGDDIDAPDLARMIVETTPLLVSTTGRCEWGRPNEW